jgi:hypothetical protein
MMDRLTILLRRFGRRLRLRDGWSLAQHSLWMAGLAAALMQLAGRVWPIANLWLWTVAPLALWLLAVIGIALVRPLHPERVARRCDAELGLKERLATAVALEGWSASGCTQPPSFQLDLVALQQQDALAAAQRIEPRRAFPLRWQWRSLLVAGVLISVTVAQAVLPNRMREVIAERQAIAQAAEQQARRVEELRKQVEEARELSPEERQELLRRLEELAQRLRDNAGDREKAVADFSKVEEALRQKVDPNADARQAALAALASQLQSLAQEKAGAKADPADMDQAMQELADKMAGMSEAERESLAQSLAQMAARAAQAGDTNLAQALASLAQAARSGDTQAASAAAQAASEAMRQAQGELDQQAVLQRALSELQQGRQAMSQAGQPQPGQGTAQVPGSGQGQGKDQGQGQGQPGGGGGTKADTLPPGTGKGQAVRPKGEGQPGDVTKLDQQVYVPWDRRPGQGEQVTLPGQDTGQGETQVRERTDPLPGAPGEALVPYHQVFYQYLDAANQAMEQSYIPSGLKDYVREYFARLEP